MTVGDLKNNLATLPDNFELWDVVIVDTVEPCTAPMFRGATIYRRVDVDPVTNAVTRHRWTTAHPVIPEANTGSCIECRRVALRVREAD